jgi:antitoxin (DNA-binding transcriptional repressor) of toxin-antitoxin stability system
VIHGRRIIALSTGFAPPVYNELCSRETTAMTVVSLEEAQARLPELIGQVQQGEAILITRDQQPVAQLVPPANGKPIPQFGSCRGKLTVVSEDDEHLQDFREYMP